MVTCREHGRGCRNPRMLWKGGWPHGFKGLFLVKESTVKLRMSEQEEAFSITEGHLPHCTYGETDSLCELIAEVRQDARDLVSDHCGLSVIGNTLRSDR